MRAGQIDTTYLQKHLKRSWLQRIGTENVLREAENWMQTIVSSDEPSHIVLKAVRHTGDSSSESKREICLSQHSRPGTAEPATKTAMSRLVDARNLSKLDIHVESPKFPAHHPCWGMLMLG